ncbi:MAG TPA: tRNA lysidine(34) synthetase TilS [Methylomirabilota bacterium]|nr:tRNA lysidine(34) synthetase TilS [Methylomirabilota bacterium]
MIEWIERVKRTLARERLLPKGSGILVAVSGGPDSVALLHLLHCLARERKWRLVIAHYNHRLRGRASDADERLVRRMATALKVPLRVGRAPTAWFKRRQGISIEMGARELRHRFLSRTARALGFRRIALAHHADDRVEGFFLRLFRGSGGIGLSGMSYRSASPLDPALTLARPLLDCRKEELMAWVRDEGLKFREDASNRTLDGLRNRIRNELLPLLRARYQPALTETVLRTIDLAREETEVVREAAERWLDARSRDPFETLPIAVQRQCIRIQLLRAGVEVNFQRVEALRQQADSAVTFRPGQRVMRATSGRIKTWKTKKAIRGLDSLKIEIGNGEGSAKFAYCGFEWRVQRGRGTQVGRKADGCEYFDADKVGRVVLLRHWRAGDRFQPIGMAGPVKLQDLFTNAKVPAGEKRSRVLATTPEGEIFWVEGLRISEGFKLDKHTRRRLKWRCRRTRGATG